MSSLYGVYGASGFGREVLPVLRSSLRESGAAGDLVFVDDGLTPPALNGVPVLFWNAFLSEPANSRHITIAIADAGIWRKLAERCGASGMSFVTLRAPNSVVMDEVRMGEGAILCPFVTLTSNIRIGKHFHANIYSYVAHDCEIGDFVMFAPAVKCNGNVRVEDDAYIGTGAVIKQGKPGAPIVIGRGAVVGMGAVVTRSVPPGVTVVGNPARSLEKN